MHFLLIVPLKKFKKNLKNLNKIFKLNTVSFIELILLFKSTISLLYKSSMVTIKFENFLIRCLLSLSNNFHCVNNISKSFSSNNFATQIIFVISFSNGSLWLEFFFKTDC